MAKATPISLQNELAELNFFGNRTPGSINEDRADHFAKLAEYRDGGIFVTHYAGNSEWERHANGDEIVMVVEGETTLILLLNDEEVANTLKAGEFLVVPGNIWHRFETP
ncbi:MAG: cupin domain-containing protein, partial [Pseudomonadota bacterium]